MTRGIIALGCAALGAVVVGCGGSAVSSVSQHPSAFAKPHAQATGPIAHVVVLIMENRSFNYMYLGYPNARTAYHGLTHDGKNLLMQKIPLEAIGDLGHTHPAFEAAYDNGKMDGFDLEGWDPRLPPYAPYAFAPHSEIAPDWDIARQYTLADENFMSVSANSYAAHQYLIAGQSDYAIGLPKDPYIWGCDSKPGTYVPVLNAQGHMVPGPFPCFDYETLADILDQAGLGWRYYTQTMTYDWNAYDAISQIRYGPDWGTDIVTPSSQFNIDVANGILAPVTWIVPADVNSDHSGNKSHSGPSYVASVVNSLGESKFWSSSALIIVWDDWGGWYDPVAPPQLDRMGLGFRVPMLVVSPWSRHNYVSHQQHEFGSVLHFVESTFGLPSLGQVDVRADDLSDCFDFTQTPPPFVPIAAPISPPELRAMAAADHAPPDN